MPNDKSAGPERTEMRPDAVLAIGVTGHREIGVEGDAADAIAKTLHRVLQSLSDTMKAVSATDAVYFSGTAPRLRLITMLAEGADLLAARAANSIGGELAAVIPYSLDEYARDFSLSGSSAMLSELWGRSATRLELSGTRGEGARAYERANELIIANCDLLIAVWDGKPARGRAGTGDVVQSALAADLPLIVIDPSVPNQAELIVAPDFESFDIMIASDLPRTPLEPQLKTIVMRRLAPPSGVEKRRALDDFLLENPRSRTPRFEYPLLLKIFRASPRKVEGFSSISHAPGTAWDHIRALTAPRQQLDPIEHVTAMLDRLADRYGRMFRSSISSRYLLIVLVSLFVGMTGIVYPPASGIAIFVQIAFNGLIVYDMSRRQKQRWQQRWLDYRSVAERLRRYRFLHPLGLGASALFPPDARTRRSWTDWFVLRHVRSAGAPHGTISPEFAEAMAKHLVNAELSDQIQYHQRAFRQLATLERKFASASQMMLISTLFIAVSMAIAVHLAGGIGHVSWFSGGSFLIGVATAATVGFNGIAADLDIVRTAERSGITAAELSRLRRAVGAMKPNYDHVAVAARRAASIMVKELFEWQFILENRRARGRRLRMSKRRR